MVGLPRFAAEKADWVEEARSWGVMDKKAEVALGDVMDGVAELVAGATGTEVK